MNLNRSDDMQIAESLDLELFEAYLHMIYTERRNGYTHKIYTYTLYI